MKACGAENDAGYLGTCDYFYTDHSIIVFISKLNLLQLQLYEVSTIYYIDVVDISRDRRY